MYIPSFDTENTFSTYHCVIIVITIIIMLLFFFFFLVFCIILKLVEIVLFTIHKYVHTCIIFFWGPHGRLVVLLNVVTLVK